MKKTTWTFILGVILCIALLLGSCVTYKPVTVEIEKIPMEQARIEIIQPLLECLRDFGNNMARIMLSDYKFVEIQETGAGDYLYRFDTINPKLPKYAYIVFRFDPDATITTNYGTKNNIQLDNGSVGLIPADEPAEILEYAFRLRFTTTGFMEGFNPHVIGPRGSYPDSLLFWFSDPLTKNEKTRRLASLLLSAFPELKYKTK